MIEILLALALHQPIPLCDPIPGLVNEYNCTVLYSDVSCQTQRTVDDEYNCNVLKYGPTTRKSDESIRQWCERQAVLASTEDAIPDNGMACGGDE